MKTCRRSRKQKMLNETLLGDKYDDNVNVLNRYLLLKLDCLLFVEAENVELS